MSNATTTSLFAGTHLRARQAAAFLGIAESTLWRWVSEGHLPRGVRLGARCTIWRKADLEAFVAVQEAAQ